jgi:hypothetical protein
MSENVKAVNKLENHLEVVRLLSSLPIRVSLNCCISLLSLQPQLHILVITSLGIRDR